MAPEHEAGRLYDVYGASLLRYALMILADPEAAEDVIQQVFVALLDRGDAIRQLPPDQREVVHLHAFEGRTFKDVAEMTGESLNTTASRYRYALETSRKPWPDRLAIDAPDIPEEPPQRRGPLYFVTAPHSRWVTVNAQRTRTTYAATMLGGVRSAIAVIAIERYRRSHAGALPSSLAELVPDRLAAVLVDPYSGSALKYKVLPDGFVVYSVGANRTDDGAQGAGTQLRRRWGANQLNEQPLDIGVKVRLQKGDSE